MSQCAYLKPKGGQCKRSAAKDSDYCYAHDPTFAEQRSRFASRAAKAKASATQTELRDEMARLKGNVRFVIAGVLEGKIDKGVGSVALQGFNTLLRAVDLERQLIVVEDHEARLQAIERNDPPTGRRHHRGFSFGP